jgi:hypothetical protein
VEFIVEVKGKRKLQRIRFFRFRLETALCPYAAMQDMLAQETEKATRLNRLPLTGPVWTDDAGKPWTSAHVSGAVSTALASADLPPKHPYHLKAYTINLLKQAGVPDVDIAKFVRHDPGAANLNRYYVHTDLGQTVASTLDRLASHSTSAVCFVFLCFSCLHRYIMACLNMRSGQA